MPARRLVRTALWVLVAAVAAGGLAGGLALLVSGAQGPAAVFTFLTGVDVGAVVVLGIGFILLGGGGPTAKRAALNEGYYEGYGTRLAGQRAFEHMRREERARISSGAFLIATGVLMALLRLAAWRLL